MAVDAKALLEWLDGSGLKDMQEMALEQFCGILLMSNNPSKCLELLPPKDFTPVLCRIFLDQTASDNVLELAARAITYYLDCDIDRVGSQMMNEKESIRAMCGKLEISADGANRPMVEQCIKVLEYICVNIPAMVFEVGGLNQILVFIKNHGAIVHKDILHSATSAICSACQMINSRNLENICIKDLTELLEHQDQRVAHLTLNSFFKVSNTFNDQRADTTPIAKFGLVTALMNRLNTTADSYLASPQGAVSNTADRNSKTITTIFKILTVLCRGSTSITQELLQSDFLNIIEKVLKLSESSVLNAIKFVDTLMAILSKKNKEKQDRCLSEKLFPEIIESVHMDDFDHFSNLLETKGFELDYTDSCGQTLLNWVAAIGSHEMVYDLCCKGADVDKGEHGTPLHYAASAGKVNTVKVLLKFGADPNIYDENRTTALGIALDGDTDDHKEVAAALEFPVCFNAKRSKFKSEQKIIDSSPIDNTKMVAVYFQRLLPVFCTAFQSTTIESVRKATLASIKFMVKHIKADTLKEFCASDVGSPNFAYQIAETIVTILYDDKETDKNKFVALKVIERLIKKHEEMFLDIFSRLGVFFHVQYLAKPKCRAMERAPSVSANKTLEDATEILPKTAYHWYHWCVCLGKNGFYVWSESVVLEFCNNSNGWIRCFINGKLHTMYSCGRIEDGDSHNALDYLIKFDAARRAVRNPSVSIPILSSPGTTTLTINNWSIISPIQSELHVLNLENPQQKTTLPGNMHDFVHESDNGSKDSFVSKRYIVPKVAGGWLKKLESPELPTDREQIMKRTAYLANSIYEKYFKNSHIQTRPAMVKLENTVAQIKSHCENQSSDMALKEVLDGLTQVLVDKEAITVYELQNSGLVPALLLLFEQKRNIELFRQCFEEKSVNGNNMFEILVQKLIFMLENVEKLPVCSYNAYHTAGINALKKTFYIRLARGIGEDHLIDRTNESFEAEPLSTVNELEEFIAKMVIKGKSSNDASASDTVLEPASDTVPEPTSDTVPEPASDVVPEPTSDTVPEPASDVVPEPTSDTVQELASDVVPEPASNVVLESAVISPSDFVPESVSSQERELIVYRDLINIDNSALERRSPPSQYLDMLSLLRGESDASVSRELEERQTILERILSTNRSNITSEVPTALGQRIDFSVDSDSSNEEQLSSTDWNSRFVLKGRFPALIRGFDPRPERYINPTSDLDILPPGVEEFTINSKDDSEYQHKLKLILKTDDTRYFPVPLELELIDGNYTIFRAMRELILLSGCVQQVQLQQIWQTQYKIVYSEVKDDEVPPKPSPPSNPEIDDVLQLLKRLFVITTSKKISSTLGLTADQFTSKKINSKLLQQMKEILIVSSSSTPAWCEEFVHSYSFLFPFETRQLYFQITAFGTTRTIMWFQAQDSGTSNNTRSGYRNNSEFGQLKTERIQVSRGPTFFDWAMQVLKMHCDRKAKLEIQFIDEEGTGLGPTLEFYSLIASKFQQRDLAMWICDDFHLLDAEEDMNPSEDSEAPGYYVRNLSGLFPAPLPQDSKLCDQVVKYFWVFGVLLAKVLQDNKLIDLPLSKSFLKLMCHNNTGPTWYQGILGLHDLYDIDPVRAEFLKEVQNLVKQKAAIMNDAALCSDSKASQIQNLKMKHMSGPISLQDLALNFTYAPSSKVFGFSAIELVPNGTDTEVTIENIEEYCNLTLSFALEEGISRQLKAFRQGFSEVFPMEKLAAFSRDELRIMICGDQNRQWTKEDLINYTEPKLGYTKESPGFLRFVNVLLDMSPEERKAFLQFTTGCSSLPPGGLANLNPRLTIVKKVDAGEGSYPSVNTCVHYLKLPEYSTEEILKERLLVAIKQTGFHFN